MGAKQWLTGAYSVVGSSIRNEDVEVTILSDYLRDDLLGTVGVLNVRGER